MADPSIVGRGLCFVSLGLTWPDGSETTWIWLLSYFGAYSTYVLHVLQYGVPKTICRGTIHALGTPRASIDHGSSCGLRTTSQSTAATSRANLSRSKQCSASTLKALARADEMRPVAPWLRGAVAAFVHMVCMQPAGLAANADSAAAPASAVEIRVRLLFHLGANTRRSILRCV